MGKLKLAANLIKLNNKLGLLDVGDLVSLAGTAYKVSNFSPSEYIDDFDIDMIINREEYERAQRRKTILTAAAVAGGAYLIYKNRDSIEKSFDDRKEFAPEIEIRTKGKKALEDVKDKGEEVVEKGKDLAEDAKDKGEKVADDARDFAKDVKKDLED